MEVGSKVTWDQAGATCEGEVLALVPPGHLPAEVMFPVEGSERMTGVSAVVRGAPVGPPRPAELYHLDLTVLSPNG